MMRKFLISKEVSIPAGDTVQFLALTNGSRVRFNPNTVSTTTAPLMVRMYEDPIITDVGTSTVTGIDTNRVSKSVPDVETWSNPTVDVTGIKPIYSKIITGSKQTGGSETTIQDFYLENNQYYLYTIENQSTNNAGVTINFLWIEYYVTS